MKICGIVIEKKTDFLSLTAFLLALAGILYQVYGFFKGPDIILFPPEQIAISSSKINNSSQEYVMFIVSMSYVNKAQPGYNGVIKKEYITFMVADSSFVHRWQELGSSSADDKGRLIFTKKADAQPVTVNAGSSESHETFFAPFSIQEKKLQQGEDKNHNYLTWQAFLDKVSKNRKIDITIVTEVYNQSDLKLKCEIDANEHVIYFLKTKKWTAPTVTCEDAS